MRHNSAEAYFPGNRYIGWVGADIYSRYTDFGDVQDRPGVDLLTLPFGGRFFRFAFLAWCEFEARASVSALEPAQALEQARQRTATASPGCDRRTARVSSSPPPRWPAAWPAAGARPPGSGANRAFA